MVDRSFTICRSHRFICFPCTRYIAKSLKRVTKLYFQLQKQGFRHIDALDPSEAMLAVAKEEKLYENYFCEFITDEQLPIPPGEISQQAHDIAITLY